MYGMTTEQVNHDLFLIGSGARTLLLLHHDMYHHHSTTPPSLRPQLRAARSGDGRAALGVHSLLTAPFLPLETVYSCEEETTGQ